ncbi:Pentatricopeptide repeat-containing protein [Camellia lanceoleosa]|uniref:Pentatricopeptide repeat-containing protein n=1 Tax=Camellia lanceoleosa TaxID=1840588 RepID=A0ACC0HF43_9ERIC|nr:Pentatricopeptide repeat-containing protein [Camellia lanceoleosa]
MMVNGYCRVNCLQEACDLFKDMKERGIELDVITYTVLVDGHSKIKMRKARYCRNAGCNDGEPKDISTFWNEMKEKKLKPDTVTYTALLCGYCSQGNVDRAVTLVNEMSFTGIQPDARFMSVLHRGILKAKEVKFQH